MKIASIILGVIAIAFIEAQIFAFQKNIETYPYVVDKKYDQFEIATKETKSNILLLPFDW